MIQGQRTVVSIAVVVNMALPNILLSALGTKPRDA
jgi:hypothetical protein